MFYFFVILSEAKNLLFYKEDPSPRHGGTQDDVNVKLNITKPTTISEIKRGWHLVDVKEEIIGRISGKIANLLMGKGKAYFAKNMDCGDYVVVINALQIKSTGKKELNKMYRKHSGYPGGFKEISLGNLRQKNPRVIIEHSVSGMLPDNKLKKQWMSKLFIFPTENHKYKDKFIK